MKSLLMRFLKDTSGEGDVLGQALLVTGSSLVVIPTVENIAGKLIATFTTLAKAIH